MTMYTESLRAFLKPVLTYLDDEAVSEIMINGPEDVWIEKKGRLFKTEARFTVEGLEGAARNMAQFVGRLINDERPRLDARLPDGSRIHVVMPPIARRGCTISIRKFFKDKPTIDTLLKYGSVVPPMVRLIEAAIAIKLNMVVSGGTGSGKTTLLNILSSLIPNDERILTIEDSAELQLTQEHLVTFESRPPDKFGKGGVDMGDLLHSALRLRPDRIVVGEVRGGECFYLMQAMNTGHGGSLSTCHANTPTDTLRRLESLCLMSAVELPMVAVRAQVASAINLIVCCERLHDGSRKTTHISEVLPLNEKGEYRTQDIFVFTPVGKDEQGNIIGYHAPTGILPTFLGKARAYGFPDLDEKFFDPATYGVPPPPVFNKGEDYSIKWVSSLKHREANKPDPESFRDQWIAFERKLKEEAGLKKTQAQVNAPSAAASSAAPKRTASTSIPAQTPPKASPKASTPVKEAKAPVARDDDKTPPPTRNPTLRPTDETPGPVANPLLDAADKTPPPTPNPLDELATDGAPKPVRAAPPSVADEPKVEISDDLLDEAAAQESANAPRKPAAARPPPSRPAGPNRIRASAPPVMSEGSGEEEPLSAADADKTHIKPTPTRR